MAYTPTGTYGSCNEANLLTCHNRRRKNTGKFFLPFLSPPHIYIFMGNSNGNLYTRRVYIFLFFLSHKGRPASHKQRRTSKPIGGESNPTERSAKRFSIPHVHSIATANHNCPRVKRATWLVQKAEMLSSESNGTLSLGCQIYFKRFSHVNKYRKRYFESYFVRLRVCVSVAVVIWAAKLACKETVREGYKIPSGNIGGGDGGVVMS